MELGSDFEQVNSAFPEARKAVLYSPVKLQENSKAEIKKDLQKIYFELSPCDVVMADISASTPVNKIKSFLDLCNKIPDEN